MKINKKDFTLVAEKLRDELLSNITGENEEWLFGKIPSQHVMVGMISASVKDSAILKGEIVDNQRFESIPSIGMRFHLDKKAQIIRVYLKGKLFYRIAPSFDEQIKFFVEKYSKEDSSITNYATLLEYLKNKSTDPDFIEPREELVFIYKSINLEDLGLFEIQINDRAAQDLVNDQIKTRLLSKVEEIRALSVVGKAVKRPITELLDKDRFNAILNSSIKGIVPNWSIELYLEVNSYEKYNEVIVQLINCTDRGNLKLSYEPMLFNGGLKVFCDNDFLPIHLNSIKHYYLDDPFLPAIGNNCTVVKDENYIETENIPICKQRRVITIDKFNEYITFDKLMTSPIENLSLIYQEMTKKVRDYEAELLTYRQTKSEHFWKSFEAELQEFKQEVNRFKYGIYLIQNRNIVYKAFYLMNKTFSLNKKYKGWRLFQIVFIVSELADIINCEFKNTPNFICNDIENVDLIYFSTGGGKTETFLGCTIFAAFFDRLRNKKDGVTAIIKYPLRLLAAQQLDRILKLTINANIVKKEEALIGEDFSVGFYTGSKNTPNDINEQKKSEISISDQDTRNSNYRQIDYCPICYSEMNVIFNDDTWRLIHKCSNQQCGFEPPIYIIDQEIYRYAPTFIVSTIDKMANIGTSLGFKSILGQINDRCEKHGFIHSGKRCTIPGCRCKIEKNIERKDPIPTLFIQDELHLVNSSLGTFDSHYESLIQYYCSSLVKPEYRKIIKYIGATATISNYEKHIKGLYSKDAKKFPTSVKKENFYSIEDKEDISRYIIGMALYGGTITESIQKLVTYMRIIITQWNQNSEEKTKQLQLNGFSGDSAVLKEILRCYLISIIYNTSKDDAGNLRATLENQGSNTLANENIPPFDIAEISSNVDFKVIKSVMHEIESEEDKYKTKNIIIATSAISHGVDEDCFNQIYFYGMPNQTSEYIQAYSRVGRAFTGLVFDIFRLIRDKDKSYLRNFYNYHTYNDLLIDPVPINRYAKNAIYSTLPGIIAGLILQHYSPNWYAMEVTKKIANGSFTLADLLESVESIYECDQADSKLYKEIIDSEVRNIFDGFKTNTSTQISVSDLIRKCGSKHKSPMTNLREVDTALEIKLSEN